MTATIRRALVPDLPAVTRYCARSLGGTADAFRRYFEYPWMVEKPQLGFAIEDEGEIRGFIGTIYADRLIRGQRRRSCNLTSIAVDESHRKLSLQLFKTALADKSVTYTSFSPSPTVVEILKFFKFTHNPVEKLVLLPIPTRLSGMAPPRARLSPAAIARYVEGDEAALVADHAGLRRCLAFSIERAGRHCVVIAVRRGRTVRAYSEIVHLSDPDVAMAALPWVQGVLTLRQGTVITMVEPRLLRMHPRIARTMRSFRPLMFRSPDLALGDIDALYTELCL